jgi:hypothetical protein
VSLWQAALGGIIATSTTATAIAAIQTYRETKRNGRYLTGDEDAGRPGLLTRVRRVERTLRRHDIEPVREEDRQA